MFCEILVLQPSYFNKEKSVPQLKLGSVFQNLATHGKTHTGFLFREGGSPGAPRGLFCEIAGTLSTHALPPSTSDLYKTQVRNVWPFPLSNHLHLST